MLTGVRKDRHWLAATVYPGRGIAVGCTADGSASVQLYWIMGRSSRSRNRRFVHDGAGAVQVAVADAAAGAPAGDTSLILYRAAAAVDSAAASTRPGTAWHVVANGDHTETIVMGLAGGDSFATAFARRDVEPDPPHYTPRIAGVVAAAGDGGYELAIIKTASGDPRLASFQHFAYRGSRPGWGHCVTTYEGDGTPLPPFVGEPFLLPIAATPRRAVQDLWDWLDRKHRVAALAKFVDRATGGVTVEIINRHGDGRAAGRSGGAA